MRVRVDLNKCIGAGLCVMASDIVFDQHEQNGLVVLRQETPAPDQYEAVRVAANTCPSGAISVEE